MEKNTWVTLLGRNPIALEGLDRVLREHGFSISAIVSDPQHVASAVEQHSQDCNLIIIDGIVDDQSTLTAQLLATSPQARVVLLADHPDAGVLRSNIAQGAHGYILKTVAANSLIGLLALVANGERVIPSELIGELANSAPLETADTRSFAGAGRLSTREVQILACLVEGQPNKIISRELGISEATVKVHVKAILRKTGVQNRTQAAIWALGERGNGPVVVEEMELHAMQPRVCSTSHYFA